MKTAVSLPDELFQHAERFAAGRGLSRSGLYAAALQSYLSEREPDGDPVTVALNEVYGTGAEADGEAGAQHGRSLIDRDEWEW